MLIVKSEVDPEMAIISNKLGLVFDLRNLIAIRAAPSCISIGDYSCAAVDWWH